MKRKLLYLTTIILTLVGCASEDYVGNEEYHRQNEYGMPISLNLVAAPQTRSVGGATAAGYLNNNFVIYGKKTFGGTNPPAPQVVFNNYQANYGTNTAGTTTSNSNDWEYVGYKNLPNGVTTDVGVPAFSALTESGQANAAAVDQTIKYWDYSASKYEFFGYSLGGTGTTTSWATSTAMSPYTFDLSGTQAQLSACYISDLLTKVDMSATNTAVQLQFRKMESKVRIALYENIPGYSVEDVKFYQDGSSSGYTAYLYENGTPTLPQNGTYTITYTSLDPVPETSQQTPASITWDPDDTDGSISYVSFGKVNIKSGVPADNEWDGWQLEENLEKVNGSSLGRVYLGRASDESTKSPWVSALPNPNGADLYLKVDYTLVSLDGYGETINVTGATATVPAAYAKWQPNCSYTYVFKITDTALYPITLDAVVNTNADGKQETITTIAEPSITTYSSNSNVVTNNEYAADEKVYAVVEDGGSLATLSASNMKLYTVTTTDATNFPITEASVADALLKLPTLTEEQLALAKIRCTDITSAELSYGKTAGDTGKEIEMDATNNVVASFTVAEDNVYVLQYIQYDAGQTYTDADEFAAAGTLYTKSDDIYSVAASWTNGTTYYKRTGVYAYKVINVKESESTP